MGSEGSRRLGEGEREPLPLNGGVADNERRRGEGERRRRIGGGVRDRERGERNLDGRYEDINIR